MEISFKGIKIGKVIIAYKDFVQDSMNVKLEPEEVWYLFKKAVKDGKIVFNSSKPQVSHSKVSINDLKLTDKECKKAKLNILGKEKSDNSRKTQSAIDDDFCKKCPEEPYRPNCDTNIPCPYAD